MDDFNYQFLSTLSPKIKFKKKVKHKGPALLSLKKHFRKSSLYDQSRSIPNESLSIVEISSTDSGSTGNSASLKSSNKDKLCPVKVNRTPSHVSDSLNEEYVSPSPPKDKKNYNSLSTSKKKVKMEKETSLKGPRTNLFNVKKWLEDVEESKKGDVTIEVFEPSIMNYEDFEKVPHEHKSMVNSTMIGVQIKSKQTNGISGQNQKSDDEDILNESSENLMDNLYGDYWRLNKDQILPSSEKKLKSKKIFNNKNLPQSERKSNTFKNPYTDEEKLRSNNLLRNLQSRRYAEIHQSPFVKKIQDLCDEDSENSLVNNDKEREIVDDSFDNCIENLVKSDDGLSLKERIEMKWGKPKKKSLEKQNTDTNSKRNSGKLFSVDKDNEINMQPKSKPPQNNDFINPNDYRSKVSSISASSSSSSSPVTSRKIRTVRKIGKVDYKDLINSSDDDDDNFLKKRPVGGEIKGKPLSFLASLSKNVPLTQCDMSARIFKNNYKQHKEELSKKLFNIYNENVFEKKIPETTKLEWSEKMLRTAGCCYSKKITHRSGLIKREARIVLSSKVLDSADRLRDTLIHELCHAATWIVDQVHNGHGVHWKAWANRAMSVYPELPPIKTCHNYEITTKYVYRCVDCGYSIGRHRKSLDIERKRCGYCYGKFEILINKTNKKGESKTVPATPKREPTGFALFVKENYANFKAPGKTHADVMKQLSEEFRKVKM